MSGLNGTPVLTVEDLPVGFVDGESYGYKRKLLVTVSIRMERLDRREQYETINHDMVSNPLDFAITTSVWKPGRGDIVSGGATVQPLRELVKPANGFTLHDAAQLADLSRWHLNALRAGCAHQTPVYEGYGHQRQVSLERTPACPVSGYRYGSAWLLEPLPDTFLDTVRGLLAKAESLPQTV